ncbi:MAG: hypothetical protein K2H85_10060 [Allobaculum sp.]|nr:hypothetical protein [Allobaculum sp.]
MGKKEKKPEQLSCYENIVVDAAFVLGDKVGPNEQLSIEIKKPKPNKNYKPLEAIKTLDASGTDKEFLAILKESQETGKPVARKLSDQAILVINVSQKSNRLRR